MVHLCDNKFAKSIDICGFEKTLTHHVNSGWGKVIYPCSATPHLFSIETMTMTEKTTAEGSGLHKQTGQKNCENNQLAKNRERSFKKLQSSRMK